MRRLRSQPIQIHRVTGVSQTPSLTVQQRSLMMNGDYLTVTSSEPSVGSKRYRTATDVDVISLSQFPLTGELPAVALKIGEQRDLNASARSHLFNRRGT